MLVFDCAPLDALRILKEAFVQVGWEGIDEFAHLLSLEAVDGPLARGIALALQFELASLLPLELVVLAARLENNFLVELLENLGSLIEFDKVLLALEVPARYPGGGNDELQGGYLYLQFLLSPHLLNQ